MLRCRAGDLAVFDSGPRTDLLGVFVEVECPAQFPELALGSPCWWVRIIGSAVLNDVGCPTQRGYTPDKFLKPIRPRLPDRDRDRSLPALLRPAVQPGEPMPI